METEAEQELTAAGTPFWEGDRFVTGVSSRWGAMLHAVQIGHPGTRWVHAACRQIVEVGHPNENRNGMKPYLCRQCVSAVYVINTLIATHDQRVGQ